jgi:hypothetical protein
MWCNGKGGAQGVHLGPHRGAGDSVAAGDSGEETVEEALGAGGTWVQREEKESGERCGRGQWGSSFI